MLGWCCVVQLVEHRSNDELEVQFGHVVNVTISRHVLNSLLTINNHMNIII
jgi:hypothetical protein